MTVANAAGIGPSPSWACSSSASPTSAKASAASRSSITEKCGATPASSGKRPSSDWQKAWMVSTFSPPGVSRTAGNSERARCRSRSFAGRPISDSRAASSSGSAALVQPPRTSAMRLAISAAAALVKVRQRIFDGGVPVSISRSARSVSTLVLPVPADAPTQTEACGLGRRPLPSVGEILDEQRLLIAVAESAAILGRTSGRLDGQEVASEQRKLLHLRILRLAGSAPADHSLTRARCS